MKGAQSGGCIFNSEIENESRAFMHGVIMHAGNVERIREKRVLHASRTKMPKQCKLLML
jgi:hypothetical protein